MNAPSDSVPTEQSHGGLVIIYIDPPQQPPQHVHQWAWAVLARGGEVQVCYSCGRQR